MITDNSAFKYETQYNGTFEITQCFTNGTVILQCDTTKIRHSICRIKPYTSDINVEYIKH